MFNLFPIKNIWWLPISMPWPAGSLVPRQLVGKHLTDSHLTERHLTDRHVADSAKHKAISQLLVLGLIWK
jgi:hypothetical protein